MADPSPAGRILITPRSLTQAGVANSAELEPLRVAGFELVSAPAGRSPSEAELLELVPGCVGWLAGVERIPASVVTAATTGSTGARLRVIARNGVGTDTIDTAAAALAGVTITTAAGANAQGVAELAVTLALSCLRQVPWSAASVRAGGWERFAARELSEVTVGVVGLGAIGRRVGAAFGALGATVVGCDPFSAAEGIRSMELDELVAVADVITLHAPPPEDGSALVDAQRLARVRPGTVLINTARASLVDDSAVLAALDNGTLSSYAVDAFATEPPELTPLLLHDRVIATPHIGAYTGASVRRATAMAVRSLLDNLNAEKPHREHL